MGGCRKWCHFLFTSEWSEHFSGEIFLSVKQQISRVKARLQARRKQITGAVTDVKLDYRKVWNLRVFSFCSPPDISPSLYRHTIRYFCHSLLSSLCHPFMVLWSPSLGDFPPSLSFSSLQSVVHKILRKSWNIGISVTFKLFQVFHSFPSGWIEFDA